MVKTFWFKIQSFAGGIHIVRMDVTDDSSIFDAREKVEGILKENNAKLW